MNDVDPNRGNVINPNRESVIDPNRGNVIDLNRELDIDRNLMIVTKEVNGQDHVQNGISEVPLQQSDEIENANVIGIVQN